MGLLKTILDSLWVILRTLLYGWLVGLWRLIRGIWDRWRIDCARARLPNKQGEASPEHCVTISDPAMKRPDPLIYDQYYLMALGFAVTWDNPDIWLELGGAIVSPDHLTPNTTYDVIARIWNGSTEAVCVGLPVSFSYLSFGSGVQSHAVLPGPDTVMVNLGAKGGPGCPTFATTKWTTPAVAGHYCLQVSFSWIDDSNPYNNLGQENTQVGVSLSPVSFEFQLGNRKQSTQELRFETDSYAIPPLPACGTTVSVASGANIAALPQRPYDPVKVPPQHDRRNYPLPPGWNVSFAPTSPQLAAGQEITVLATVTPPAGFLGRQPINVHVFSGSGLEGGMTFYIDGS
jgi:hypothetical protein